MKTAIPVQYGSVKTGQRSQACAPRVTLLMALALNGPLLFCIASGATAQNVSGNGTLSATPSLFDVVGSRQENPGAHKPSAPLTSGTSFREVLRGNGSRFGYALSHGGVVPGSFSLHGPGGLLRPDRDYWLDTANGTLIFAQPIRRSESIRISYRYAEGQEGIRQGLSLPGLQLEMGRSARMNLFYGMSPVAGGGFDVSTYGLSLNSRFGSGKQSSYSGLVYFSSLQANTNLALPARASSSAPQSTPRPVEGNDHLIVQNLALQSGGLQLRGVYEDIGAHFAGFQTLRQNAAQDKTLLEQLTLREGEKGVRRLGFGLGYSSAPQAKAPRGLALDWNQIRDATGVVSRQTAGLSTGALNLNYAARSIGETFSSFKGLRESEKGQWEREKGMRSSLLDAGLLFGTAKKPSGGLDFQEQRFADKSGSLRREMLALQAGTLRFSLWNRSADRDFKRLNDLSEADKTTLALDLYRQYNPAAKPEQVTPNDRVQIAREAGFQREALRIDLAQGKKGAFSFSEQSLTDTPKDAKETARPGLSRQSLSIETTPLTLTATRRRTDQKFTRIADLADVEKSYLALDIRRQFDPEARLEQVTPKEREQAIKEAGLERSLLRGRVALGKDVALSLTQISIRREPGEKENPADSRAIHREVVALTGKKLSFDWMRQRIDTHFAGLAELSDLERARFGNEYGLQRSQQNLLWQLDKTSQVRFSSLGVRGDPVQAAAALAVAGADRKKLEAARALAAGFLRESFALESKGLSLLVNRAQTDRDFTRAADLALPDADKQSVEADRGFHRTDYAVHLDRIRGLTLDTFHAAAVDGAERKRDIYRDSLLYKPNPRLTVTYAADGDLAALKEKVNGSSHSHFQAHQSLGKGMSFTVYQDETATYEKGDLTKGAHTDYLQFTTNKESASAVQFESRNTSYNNGKYERANLLNVHAKPVKSLRFGYTRQEINRGEDPKDPSESANALDFQWQATQQFAVIAAVSHRDTTNHENASSTSVGLQGEPFKNVALAAKFDEVHNDGKNTRDLADISVSNKAPFHMGALRDLTVTARYASLNDQRKLQNETMTGRAAWTLWKNQCILDYGGYTLPDGKSTISRFYSFVTDPNPKHWFHGSFLYKVRTLVDGQEKLIRRFAADARLSKVTSLTYLYGTLPEDEKGTILPQTTADLTLKHQFRTNLNLLWFYRINDNAATKILTRSLGMGLEGKISRDSRLELAISTGASGFSDRYDRTQHYRLLFDRQISSDHSVTLSAEWRTHDGKDLRDEIQANLDFHRRF